MTSRTPGVCLFVFCVSLFACKKKDKSDFVPRAGNYVLAGHYIAQDAVMYVAGEKITDKQLIEDFSYRRMGSDPYDTPEDIQLARHFTIPGRHPIGPSSLTLTIDGNGNMNFQEDNFPGAPDTTGQVVGRVGEYAVVETSKMYPRTIVSSVVDICPSPEHEGVFAVQRLDSVKNYGFFEMKFFTERFVMRFVNGYPEMYLTRVLYVTPLCSSTSSMFNVPHPDIIDHVASRDTLVAQIWALPFVRQ